MTEPERGPARRAEPADCEEALRKLATYLDRELPGPETARIRRHLETCRSCFSRAEFERRLKERIRDELRVDVLPPGFAERMKGLLEELPGDR